MAQEAETRRYSKIAKYFLVRQRIILTILAWLGVVISYMLRNCVTVSLVRMAIIVDVKNKTLGEEYCQYPDDAKNVTTEVINMERFKWTNAEKGWILGIFYYGYCVLHMPGGFLAEQYGGKHVLAAAVFGAAILNALIPLATMYIGWWGIFILRFMIGMMQGSLFPALNSLLSDWIPASERARIGTFSFSGILLGSIVGSSATGGLIEWTHRWDVPYYVFGVVTLVWFIFWQLLVYSKPSKHPFISEKEYEYLRDNIAERNKMSCKKTPWLGVVTNVPVLALMVAEIGHDWGIYSMQSDLPTYFDEVLKFSISKSGLFNALPYACMWCVAMIAAFICDALIARKKCSVGALRKIFTGIAGIGPGMFIMLASYSGCNRTLAITCFCFGMGSMGCYYPGLRVNGMDLTRNYAGIVMGFVNGVGTISGMIAPPLNRYITPNHTLFEWRIAFWINLIVLAVSVVIYSIFASGKRQAFDDPDYVWPGCCKKKATKET